MRRLARGVLNLVGVILSLPWVLWARLPLLFGSELPYANAAYALCIVPGVLGEAMRRAFYCLVLPKCHWDLHLHFGSAITHPTARLGRRVWIGAYSLIGRARIGDDVIIGSRVSVLSGRHPHRFASVATLISEQEGTFGELTIGEDSWIGEAATVMADIGRQCVVGAGSVVVKPVPDRWVVAGNPARQIGVRGQGEAAEPAAGP